MTSSQEERQIEAVNGTWDAIESGDRERLQALADELVHPQCEWTPLLAGIDGRTYHGPDGMVAFFTEWLDTFDPRYEDRSFEQLADGVMLARCRLKLESRGSGLNMDREVALIAEFEDGLLKRGRVYDSRAEALEGAKEILNA